MKIGWTTLLIGALVGSFSAPLYAADLGYVADQYSYDYCLELAREEAGANIGMVYLHPQIVAGEEAAVPEKAQLKERKQGAQREQRKEKCI